MIRPFLISFFSVALCHAATMDVIVTNKGAAIKDLVAKDFKLMVDGKEQTVTHAVLGDKIRKQTFILLFDTTSLKADQYTDLRRQLQTFIDANARPDRSFAVLTYTGVIREILGLTSDPAAIKSAIDRTVTGAVLRPDWNSFSDAMGSLARAIGTIPGRKTMFLFSDSLSFVEQRSVAGADFDALIDNLRAADIMVNTVSQNGRAGSDLVDGTRGTAIRINNNLSELLTKVADQQDAAYVVTYEASANPKNGCRKVSVSVAATGAKVNSRQLLCD